MSTPSRLNAAHEAAHEAVAVELVDRLTNGYVKVLRRAGRDMAAAFRAKAQALTSDASMIPPDGDEVVPSSDDLGRAIERRGAAVRREAADAISDALRVEGISFDVGGVFNDELLEHVGAMTTFAGERDLRKTYEAVIVQAVEEGWSVPQTATWIKTVVGDAAEGHAKTYARTELNGLANGGSNEVAQKVLGEQMFKVWLATDDEVTRDSHLDADGQTVAVNDHFIVGGAPMRYPGDPFGPGDEVYNCRCTLVYTDSLEGISDDDPLKDVRPTEAQLRQAEDLWMTDRAAQMVQENSPEVDSLGEAQEEIERFKSRIESKLRRELAPQSINVRARGDVAVKIVEKGRFQSQFEAQSSNGVYDPYYRADEEHRMFSYPEQGFPDRERPIYGYVNGVTEEHPFGVGGYGEVAFVLKPFVRARTTFTATDSLGSGLVPSPIGRPSYLSVHVPNPRFGGRLHRLDEPLTQWQTPYWEAQIHGGVSIEDVDRIVVYYATHDMSQLPLAERTAQRLRDALERGDWRITVEVRPYPVREYPGSRTSSGASVEDDLGVADDRLGVEVVGNVLPVAAREDAEQGQLVADGLEASVVHAYQRRARRVATAAREEHESVAALNPDHLHATNGNGTGGGRRRAEGLPSAEANEEATMSNTLTENETQVFGPLGETGVLTANGDGDIEMRDPIAFDAVLCVEGAPTEDGRLIERGALTWRDLPLTLMGMTENPEFGGHAGAEVSGRIDTIERQGDDLVGLGELTTEFGVDKLAPMIADRTVRGVSVDLAVMDYEIRDAETGEKLDAEEELDYWLEGKPVLFVVLDGIIMGATVCPMPAIANAEITVTASAFTVHGLRMTIFVPFRDVLAAAAATQNVEWTTPPRSHFEVTEFPGPTPLTITDDGRVFGHLADWHTCHTGIQGVCTTAPRSPSGYAYFHVGEVVTAEGERVAIGKLMFGTKHASLSASRMQATQHYDDHGQIGAYVRAFDGEHGIWLSGVVAPTGVGREDELRANPPSGDWRSVSGSLELVAACMVPVPGFPIPRVEANIVAAGGLTEVSALIVQSGVIVPLGAVQEAMVAAGCGCEDELPTDGVDDLADLSIAE